LTGSIRAAVRRIDPNLPIANVRPMTRVVAASLATPRLTGTLLTIFAAVALTLAAVGVSGVLAYLVSRRRREIGIRMALGASRGSVVGLVVRRGVATAGIGIGVGLLAALFLTRLLEGMLYEVEPRDPRTFVFVTLVFAGIALVASGVPALRAAKVDPLEALRAE
jgi:ABC-type antimicrobial peptide transport system permease subunit